MFALNRRARSLVAGLGAVVACAGFGLVPLYGRSAGEARHVPAELLTSSALALAGETSLRMPRVDDPFSRPLPDGAVAVQVRTTPAGASKDRAITVRAIVAGPGNEADALVTFGDGSVRIVAPGDPLDSSKVVSIDPSAIVLQDGRRLKLEASP